MAIGYGVEVPKPESRKREQGRQERLQAAHITAVRKDIFAATDDTCVVCGWPAESMHEINPASVVGSRILATTRENSVPVCGSGTTKCHGLLQQKIIMPVQGKAAMRFMVDVESSRHPEVVELNYRILTQKGR